MSNPINDITIIIPARADVGFLKTAVNSIRSKKIYDSCKILIGADTPTKEVSEWLEENKNGKFDFITFVEKDKDRVGIVKMVESLIDRVQTKFVFYMHDDMVIGDHTLENLLRMWEPKKILSAKRVEPPLYPETPEKHIRNFGLEPEEFNEKEFLAFEKEVVKEHTKITVEGFFAPHFFAKKDWVGYDHMFVPQSREDSDLALRFVEQGCELITVWDSLVYHFSGRGSRKKEGVQKDSEEWQRTNYKNTNNYIRKWGTLKHTAFIMPEKAPDIKISAHVLVGQEKERMFNFIRQVEPWFDELVFVFDTENSDGSIEELKRYIQFQESIENSNFESEKIKIYFRDLNNDFAAQTNFAISKCSNDWTMKIDVDEVFPEEMLSNLRFLIADTLENNPNVTVIGFPRVNLLDGKVSNDIPREHWFTEAFDQYPARVERIQNMDVQFRLHKKCEEWVGKVHEVPQSVLDRDMERVIIADSFNFFHPKDRNRQYQQEQKYFAINKGKAKETVTKYVYDSVIYTLEGITKHAREEVKELAKRGNQILLIDQNYKDSFGDEFKNFYAPINLFDMSGGETDNYVTIINQPPVRWAKSEHLKNKIGYLAFEGLLNNEWTNIINNSGIVELWTPSSYCKEMFIKSGVKKPITVIPHGIDPEQWKPVEVTNEELLKLKEDKFMFLACGTFHNNRKGFDLLARAFNEEFAGQEDVKLLFKVNKIYNRGEGFNDYLQRYVNLNGNTSIEYLDKDMSEDELRDLFVVSDCYVSPHRSEGFGINILNALAAGTPVVTTGATGNTDFCNEDNCLLVEVEDRERWAPWIHPYERSKWPEPKLDSLKKQLRKAYEEHDSLKKKAVEEVSPKIREEWSWAKAVDKIEQRVKELF